MAFSLANFKKKTKDVQVTLDGETFAASYRVAAFTPELEAELRSVDETDSSKLLPTLLSQLIASADVEDGDAPVEWTEDGLRHQPTLFLKAVAEAVLEDLTPGEASDAGSFGG